MNEELKKELESLKVIADQFASFKEELGTKADKTVFETSEQTLKEMRESLEKGQATDATLNKQIEALNKTLQDQHQLITEMREEMAAEKGEDKKPSSVKIKEAVKTHIEKAFGDRLAHKNLQVQTNLGKVLVSKAPEVMQGGVFYTGANTVPDVLTGRAIDPEFYQRKRKRNLILDHFDIRFVDAPTLYYIEKVEIGTGTAPDNGAGGADWITSVATKPLRSFRVSTAKVDAKKVAIRGNVADKLLRDVASLENWLREDMMDEIMESYNDALLNNDPGSNADAPLGLKTEAIQFVASAAFDETIEDPNYIDAIIAVVAYMATLKERPAKVFIADDVFYAIHNLKASDGKYLNNNLVYTNPAGQLFIAGVEVVRADSEDVPSTHVLAISDDVGFKIRNYGGLTFETGLNGTDFADDKTSYRAFQEVLSYIASNRENSVLYDTWANVYAAILKPEDGE